MRQWRGFTLLELMLSVAVLGIMLAIAVPSFQSMIQRNNLTATANDLVIALISARSEAVKLECYIELRRLNSNWNSGWGARIKNTIPNGCPNNQEILRHESSSRNITITPSGSVNASIIYKPDGRSTATATGKFGLSLGDQARAVCISINGRAYVPSGGKPNYTEAQWLALCP